MKSFDLESAYSADSCSCLAFIPAELSFVQTTVSQPARMPAVAAFWLKMHSRSRSAE